jgi:hypothetical protein
VGDIGCCQPVNCYPGKGHMSSIWIGPSVKNIFQKTFVLQSIRSSSVLGGNSVFRLVNCILAYIYLKEVIRSVEVLART